MYGCTLCASGPRGGPQHVAERRLAINNTTWENHALPASMCATVTSMRAPGYGAYGPGHAVWGMSTDRRMELGHTIPSFHEHTTSTLLLQYSGMSFEDQQVLLSVSY